MRLGREWLAAAAIATIAATAGTDLVLIATDTGSPARAAANLPWPAPEVPRHVAMAPAATSTPTPPPPSPPAAPATPKLAANSVAIPGQHVRAPIIDYCPIIDGGLEPPSDVHQVCYWAGGADIGDRAGTTVLTGHINWVGQGTGAFGNLAALHRGDTVYTSDARRTVTAWRIRHVEHRSKALGVDPDAFVGHRGPRRLYLISCGGAFDPAELSYVDNIYVLAEPVPAVKPAPPPDPAPPPPPPLPTLR
jgi:hypothetical protein